MADKIIGPDGYKYESNCVVKKNLGEKDRLPIGGDKMKMREEYTCPLELTHDATKGKWKPIILWQLGNGAPQQPSDLEKMIHGINQKMLLEQLAELMDVGMVAKKSYGGYPLRTEYTLTGRGKKMLQAITIMQGIGIDLMLENGMDDVLRAAGFVE